MTWFAGPAYKFIIGGRRCYVSNLLQEIRGNTGDNFSAWIHERLGKRALP